MLGPASAYTLKIRGGCEGGGKGALVQEDVSATLSTRQDQTLFQSASKGEAETRDRECSGFLYHGSADARSDCAGGRPTRRLLIERHRESALRRRAVRYAGGWRQRTHRRT